MNIPSLNSQLVEMVPVELLSQWACPTYSPCDDQQLLNDIKENGVQEPVVIGVGLWSQRARLDTGNHRIYLAPRLGITHLPAVARVGNYCAFSNSNGDHSFATTRILHEKQWIENEYWSSPSAVLKL